MDRVETPPDVVIRRLPLYARSLRALLQQGVTLVSSHELGDRIQVTAAQIRKDLSYFGEFGRQGIGYQVAQLLHQIERILGLTQEWHVALVGIGYLGTAIAHHEDFHRHGIRIAALFDRDPNKIGTAINGMPVLGDDQIPRIIRARGIRLAIIAVPAPDAQEVADRLIAAGVRAILNYAPIVIQVPEGVWVREIDPVVLLHSMTYYLAATKRLTSEYDNSVRVSADVRGWTAQGGTTMLARAYVLIEAEVGQVAEVIAALRGLQGVRTADVITGPYDIIAIIELPEQRAIGRLVMDDIHGIAGIKRTITCLAL